jgi:hypothetical protein
VGRILIVRFEWLRAKRNGLAGEFVWPLVTNLFKLRRLAQSYQISGANGANGLSELWQYAGSSKNPTGCLEGDGDWES